MTPGGGSRGPASASLLAVVAMVAWGIAYVPSAWLVESWPPLLAALEHLVHLLRPPSPNQET